MQQDLHPITTYKSYKPRKTRQTRWMMKHGYYPQSFKSPKECKATAKQLGYRIWATIEGGRAVFSRIMTPGTNRLRQVAQVVGTRCVGWDIVKI